MARNSSIFEATSSPSLTPRSFASLSGRATAIAGIYGMNFANMPELKTDYGYFIVLGVIALLCSGLYVRFKKARWL